jgi:hypothetical protein
MALSFFAPFAPLLWAVVASVIWWRQLASPSLFLAIGALTLLGVQVVIASLWEYMPLFSGNYFLEAGQYVVAKPLNEVELVRLAHEKSRIALIQAGLVLVAAVPLLWWLKSGLAAKY